MMIETGDKEESVYEGSVDEGIDNEGTGEDFCGGGCAGGSSGWGGRNPPPPPPRGGGGGKKKYPGH